MRIVIPTADYPPIEGGISTVALHVSRELAGLGHEVTVVAPWFPDMDGFDAAEPVRVVRFGGYRWGWLRILPMLWKTWPFLRRADLVAGVNASHGGVIARLAKARYGRHYVTFAYAYEFLRFAHTPLLRSLLQGVYCHAQCVARH